MKLIKNYKGGLLFLCILITLTVIRCGKDDNYTPQVTGRVVEANDVNKPIPNARVIFNSIESIYTSDDGNFITQHNLGNYLADSISFYVTKEGYKAKAISFLIGNVQKDIFIIELEKN